MSQSFLAQQENDTPVCAWLYQDTTNLDQEKDNLRRAQRQLKHEQMELECEKRDFILEKKLSEEWIARQQLLFEQKWKIMEAEIQELAKERDRLKLQSSQSEVSQDYSCFFFRGITNVLTLKKRYKDLIKIYHPDNLAGDTFAIQEINKQYEELRYKL